MEITTWRRKPKISSSRKHSMQLVPIITIIMIKCGMRCQDLAGKSPQRVVKASKRRSAMMKIWTTLFSQMTLGASTTCEHASCSVRVRSVRAPFSLADCAMTSYFLRMRWTPRRITNWTGTKSLMSSVLGARQSRSSRKHAYRARKIFQNTSARYAVCMMTSMRRRECTIAMAVGFVVSARATIFIVIHADAVLI